MFADLRFIDTIDLAENQISEVQRESFKNIYLTKINMSHNFIEEMADNTFRNCENMTFLDLSHNYLYGILPTVFGDNSYTLDLRLQFNYLTTMAGVPMDHQVGIKTLNVSYNQVRSNFLIRCIFSRLQTRNNFLLTKWNLHKIEGVSKRSRL